MVGLRNTVYALKIIKPLIIYNIFIHKLTTYN